MSILKGKKGTKDTRITERRKRIFEFLPADFNNGKTYDDVSDYVGYSIATVSGDLEALKIGGFIDCTSGRPAKWFKLDKGNSNYDGDVRIQT